MLSLLRCFEHSRVTSGRNLPAVKLCSVIDAFAFVRSLSDAETAAADERYTGCTRAALNTCRGSAASCKACLQLSPCCWGQGLRPPSFCRTSVRIGLRALVDETKDEIREEPARAQALRRDQKVAAVHPSTPFLARLAAFRSRLHYKDQQLKCSRRRAAPCETRAKTREHYSLSPSAGDL